MQPATMRALAALGKAVVNEANEVREEMANVYIAWVKACTVKNKEIARLRKALEEVQKWLMEDNRRGLIALSERIQAALYPPDAK